MPFELNHKALGTGVTLLELTGTMTMGAQLQKFEWTIQEFVKNENCKIAVEMSRVSFIDSAALGVLVNCEAVVRGGGGEMRLAALTERVAGLLNLTRLDRVLPVDATIEDSITALTSAS